MKIQPVLIGLMNSVEAECCNQHRQFQVRCGVDEARDGKSNMSNDSNVTPFCGQKTLTICYHGFPTR